MWIEQKVYTLKSEKGGNVKSEDILNNVFLRVNENLTTVTLKQLFLKHSDPSFEDNILEVKGYSILEKVIPLTGDFFINDQKVKISFNHEEIGNLEIIEIENPLFQANDKSIEDEDVDSFNKKIIELSQLKTDDNKEEENVNPHTETSSDIVPIFNKKYENGKVRYINNGYKEFVDGDFRLLLKNDSVLIFKIVSEDEIIQFENIEEKNENEFLFSYNDDSYVANVSDGKLKVEEIQK